MAKVTVVKGKAAPTRRNALYYIKAAVPYINSISIIYILLRMFKYI